MKIRKCFVSNSSSSSFIIQPVFSREKNLLEEICLEFPSSKLVPLSSSDDLSEFKNIDLDISQETFILTINKWEGEIFDILEKIHFKKLFWLNHQNNEITCADLE